MQIIERHQRYIGIIQGFRDEYKIELAELSVKKLTSQEKKRVVYIIDRIRYADNTISIIEQAIAKLKIKEYA